MLNFFVYPRARVANRDAYVTLCICFAVLLQAFPGDNLGLEDQPAAIRHRVARIDADVQQRLGNLVQIYRDRGELMIRS